VIVWENGGQTVDILLGGEKPSEFCILCTSDWVAGSGEDLATLNKARAAMAHCGRYMVLECLRLGGEANGT
jgi:hypothetical protein